ncbi:hypothetical protein [Streptomyces tailanensis]|uniref:hypothetical protein n=1 Tax=Streptomyces tailanensis TaxID=2569858 RepID=UPI00122E183C|nr:hypothetical protein [Streptomyces tailanensis]
MAPIDDAESAFRFVEWFAEYWLSPLEDEDGRTAEEITAAEHRLGLRLPATLTSCYRLPGRRGDLTSRQDRLLRPDQLRLDKNVLVFRVENQHCAVWGVRVSQLAQPDPPVVFRELTRDCRTPWRPFLERLSLAAVEMILSEALLSAEPADDVSDNRELDERALQGVEEHFERLPFPDYPLWADPDGPPVRWFAGADLILRDDARQWLWVRGRTTAQLDTFRAAFPGDWIMQPD